MAIEKKLYTVDEFERFLSRPENRDRRFELINGEIIELSPTELHGSIQALLAFLLMSFVRPRKLGRVTTEARHGVPRDQYNDSVPDVAFTSAERLLPIVTKGAVPQMPDLAIEIKSPDDTYKGLRAKAAYYIAHGSRMVWLVFPEKQIAEVYQPNTAVQVLTEHDEMVGGPVLPGFRLTLGKVFGGRQAGLTQRSYFETLDDPTE